MDNFEVLNHYSIPSDILMDMLSTYKLLGKSDAYKNQLLEQESYIQNEVLEKDTFYAIKLLKIDNISDNRLRLLIAKNSLPKNKQEEVVIGLKKVFVRLHYNAKRHLSFNGSDLLDYLNTIFGKKSTTFSKDVLTKNDRKVKPISIRLSFERVLENYHLYRLENKFEPIFLSVITFMEMINLQPYSNNNEIASVLSLYYMMLLSEVYAFEYISFMELYFTFRKDIEEEFRSVIGNRIGDQIEVEYVYQDLADIPAGFEVPEGRTKPWGTGQAVLCCKDVVKEPFVIINADDYYGKEAFKLLHDYLIAHAETADKMQMGMAGFILKNTVSENGIVTRGVCVVDENGMLEQIHETTGISIQADGVHCDSEAVQKWITPDSNVSMNMWAGYPDFIQVLDERFAEFLKDEAGDPLKKEYLLPNIVGDLLKEGNVDVKVLETHDKWIGITYKEDTELAQVGFKKMTEDGVYPKKLWN